MKKILTLLCSMMFVCALFLTGCGGLSNFENTTKGIIYGGGNSVVVGDYLFYANGFSASITSASEAKEYNEAKKYSAINRIKLSELKTKDKYTTPEDVEKMSDLDVVGFEEGYMFAYGQQVYYVSPNTHRTKDNKQNYKYTSIFKINLDGSGRKEIFTTKNEFDATKGKIVAIEYNEMAYLLIYDGTNLTTFDITNNQATKKASLDSITSVAFPQENNDWDGNIYFTRDQENLDGVTGNEVYKIAANESTETKLTPDNEVEYTVTFTGRINNDVYYTLIDESISKTRTCVADTTDILSGRISTSGKEIYVKEISNIIEVEGGSNFSKAKGFIFTSNGSIMYQNTKNVQVDPVLLINSTTYTNAKIICVAGPDVYFATSSGIYRVSVLDRVVSQLVSGMTITTSVTGFAYSELDGEIMGVKDIYFFAQRVYEPEAETEDKTETETEEVEEKDTNIYLYRLNVNTKETQLFGKTI